MSHPKTRNAHGDLGPIHMDKVELRRAKPGSHDKSQPGGEFHHFGGIDSQRQPLPNAVLAKLGDLMQASVVNTDPTQKHLNQPDGDRPGVPAGYTYLFQLAAHDTLQSALPARIDGETSPRPRNMRRTPLELETIFGGGPMVCPFAFDNKGDSAKLRTGAVKDDSVCPWEWASLQRDLPRTNFQSGGGYDPHEGLETVLVTDARNDDNTLIAQLTTLFHGIYNYLLAAQSPSDRNTPSVVEETARRVLIRVYRRIVREDLLKRILLPDIFAIYRKGGFRLDRPTEEGSTSLEFAFAAGRLGHAMVRDQYHLNTDLSHSPRLRDVLNISSNRRPKFLPLRKPYIVDWNLFFGRDAQTAPDRFNWALRFGPKVVGDMKTAKAAGTTTVADTENHNLVGTVFRDLFRETSILLLTVNQLVGQALTSPPSGGWGKVLDNIIAKEEQQALVAKGLRQLGADSPGGDLSQFSPAELKSICENPPLSLFLMLEARQLGDQGATLGPLGSILVAEAFWPAFHPQSWETETSSLSDVEKRLLGKEWRTMPDLLAALKAKGIDLF